MKIGFYTIYDIFSTLKSNKRKNVIGDEVLANSFCKYLRRIEGVEKAEVFGANRKPDEKFDVMIYMNCSEPDPNWADVHIGYFQNGYYTLDKWDTLVGDLKNKNYDGLLFYSEKLQKYCEKQGLKGEFLPFAADLEEFYPVEFNKKYAYDVAYVGNDIKGRQRTIDYLFPALKYNFGLFGNWKSDYELSYVIKEALRFNFSRVRKVMVPPPEKIYRKELAKYSKGNMLPKNAKHLYSSSKIILNYGILENVDMDNITLRTYEVLACRGFLISDRVDSAEKLLDGCVVFSDGGKDLEEKIEYYLLHSEEKEKIAQKGYEYVTNYANMETRTKELYKYVQSCFNAKKEGNEN